ncbi:uncharacterized protein LACBIDRAFT_329842 [Laccaria bicolor S238N-H82]|uniref:Predicted protein n=1 Tax=Laccaria bicolor (strain S238N-H82 / ATCC MYA-4686) TaxID=486041 RepID=B0DJE9_LACBS|nr:uncharacterized protein LACBIDRAFT_329842 [Laccaria bicolor S238N-H82]EDR05510.1 predicted protein [Laccaria bicolor S238N-H82]|eukprot:XP_001884068.1 predicted protein [Laccaria bicolor S238N-H82]
MDVGAFFLHTTVAGVQVLNNNFHNPATGQLHRFNALVSPIRGGSSFGTNRAIVPMNTDYITASGKQPPTLLHTASNVIPVPLLKEAVQVALKIIELSEDVEGSKKAFVNAMKCVEGDIRELLRFVFFASGLRTSNDLVALSGQDLKKTATNASYAQMFHGCKETPWNAPGGTLKHVFILITMRGIQPFGDKVITLQSRVIQPIDKDARMCIFHDINLDSENDPDFKVSLATLGHKPFAVTLIPANLGKQGQPTARVVESGTTNEDLSWWALTLDVSMIPSAIAGLFISCSSTAQETPAIHHDPVLFGLPPVQPFMQRHSRNNARRYADSRFLVNAQDLTAEGTNIQSVLFSRSPSPDSSEKTIEAFIARRWNYYGM